MKSRFLGADRSKVSWLSRLLASKSKASTKLRNGELASYAWGESDIYLSRRASTRVDIVRLLTDLQESRLSWSDQSELLGIISVLHEFAHYEQDILTGVGNSDFTWRCTVRNATLAEAQRHFRTGAHTALDPDSARSIVDNFGGFLFVGSITRAGRHMEAIAQLLESKGSLRTAGAEAARSLTPEAVLELDATCSVFNTLLELDLSVEAHEQLHGVGEYWQPYAMPKAYREPYLSIVKSLLPNSGAKMTNEMLSLGHRTVGFLCGLSLAYPSSRWFRKQRTIVDGDNFEPGLRLMRMLYALMKHHENGGRWGSWKNLEEVVRRTEDFIYPTTDEIILDWIESLSEWRTYRGLAEMRINALRKLLESHNRIKDKPGFDHDWYSWHSISHFIELDLPISLYREGEPRGKGQLTLTNRAFDPHYMADKHCLELDNSLVAFLLGHTPGYVCPLAEIGGGSCDAMSRTCLSPFMRLDRLPMVEGCKVRQYASGLYA